MKLSPFPGVVVDARILLGQRVVEIGGHARRACPSRVLVGGKDQLGELVDQGELGRGEEAGGSGGRRGGTAWRGRCGRRAAAGATAPASGVASVAPTPARSSSRRLIRSRGMRP